MIKFENIEVTGWEHAIRGMRNPLNSHEKSDSKIVNLTLKAHELAPGVESLNYEPCIPYTSIGPNDFNLMKRLRNAGTDHRKFMRMITVYVDITAPLYWWKEFDTYKVGTVANSCSTMHKIHAKEFTLEDFSCEHLLAPLQDLRPVVDTLNMYREMYLETKDKKYWWQMIQLLPSSYNQKRTVMLNYEVLANVYKGRRNHKLDEWCETDISEKSLEVERREPTVYLSFCDWIKTLPYSELIAGEFKEE